MSVRPSTRPVVTREAPTPLLAPTVPLIRPEHGDAASTWGWALVEIRSDGTCGEPQVIPAPGAEQPSPVAVRPPVPSSLVELSDLLKDHLGASMIGVGDRGDVVALLLQGANAASAETRSRFLGPLAHVESIQGDLRRAERHAEQVLSDPCESGGGAGQVHALLARAWVALERAEFDVARRHLDTLDEVEHGHDTWLLKSRLLLDAKLSIAIGAPEAATRLLAAREAAAPTLGPTDWLSELLTVARAEALIASGEPQRAMALLTPVPQHAVVEAMVVAAHARRTVGDVRGALAVLSRAVPDLDHAPLALQIEAWLLEARMAADQRRADRARLLIDRALRSATSEGMRRAVLRDWGWLRRTVERDPGLMRKHRDFLASCPGDDPTGSLPAPVAPDACEGTDQLRPSQLTEREGQVLGLLAQMNSTEEIAAALFVSTNTVKTHLKGIFGKLGVNRRVDAVRRGRALGLC